jgi:hypothetical protein
LLLLCSIIELKTLWKSVIWTWWENHWDSNGERMWK